MRIVCDRCKKSIVDFDNRSKWLHIETSNKSFGKLGDYYICPKCRYDFYNFMDNKTVNTKEE